LNTHNPTWNAPYSVMVGPGTRYLKARVLTRGKKNKRHMLGEAVLFMNDLKRNPEVDAWFRLDGRQKLGWVTVKVKTAEGLVAADRGGKSDPFVEIRLGKSRQQTKVRKRTLNPIWEEEFSFHLWSVLDDLEMRVYDWDAVGENDLLGLVKVPIENLLRRSTESSEDFRKLGEGEASVTQTIALEGLNGGPWADAEQTVGVTGVITFEMSFKADFGIRRRVGFLRVVADYVCPAMSAEEASEMEMSATEQAAEEEDEMAFDRSDTLLQEMEDVLKSNIAGNPTLSRSVLTKGGISEHSVTEQIRLYQKHGGVIRRSSVRRGSMDPLIKSRTLGIPLAEVMDVPVSDS